MFSNQHVKKKFFIKLPGSVSAESSFKLASKVLQLWNLDHSANLKVPNVLHCVLFQESVFNLNACVSFRVKELVSAAVSPKRVELTTRMWSLKPSFFIFCFFSKPSSSWISSTGGWCPADASRALFLRIQFFQKYSHVIRRFSPTHVKDKTDETIPPESSRLPTF